MKVRRCIIPLITIFISIIAKAQSFKQGDAVLNLFTINDSLKYFEFYTPEFPHGDVECGILKKTNTLIYTVSYVEGSNFMPFNLAIWKDSVFLQKLADTGYLAYSFNGTFKKFKDVSEQIVPKFHLNYETLYRAKKALVIKSYEYPSFAAKTRLVHLAIGEVIEEKWGVGKYPNYSDYHPIKNKTWIAVVYHKEFIGWLLLSDVESKFKKIKGI